MAPTPTQEAGLIAIFNAFVTAGYATQAELTSTFQQLRLEQQLRALQSQAANLRTQYAVDTSEYNDALAASQAAQAAKQSEIDAL